MSTCNWLVLQTLGSRPVMPKNLPDHCFMLGMEVSLVTLIDGTARHKNQANFRSTSSSALPYSYHIHVHMELYVAT